MISWRTNLFKALFERLVSEFQLQFCHTGCSFTVLFALFLTLVGEWWFSQPPGPGRGKISRRKQAGEISEEKAEETLREPSEKVTMALPFSLVDGDKSVIDHSITCPFKIPSLPSGQGQEAGLPWRHLTHTKEIL